MRKHINLGLVTLGAAAAIVLTACGGYNNDRGRGDAPVGGKDSAPADVLNFPDLFANVAMKCDGHGHRVYVTTRDNTPPTVITDPSCPGGVAVPGATPAG